MRALSKPAILWLGVAAVLLAGGYYLLHAQFH
jgi:hypothetical protein